MDYIWPNPRPHTLSQLVEELRAHIPHDHDYADDEPMLREHGDRYRKFQKEQP